MSKLNCKCTIKNFGLMKKFFIADISKEKLDHFLKIKSKTDIFDQINGQNFFITDLNFMIMQGY